MSASRDTRLSVKAVRTNLDSAVAKVFIDGCPELSDSIRELRSRGLPKSEVVSMVTRQTKGNPFMRSGLLLLVDELWQEDQQ